MLLRGDDDEIFDRGPPRRNLFFALQPPPEVRGRIAAITEQVRRAQGLTAPPMAPERLHVSLNSLGVHAAWPAPLVARAAEAVSRLRIAPFEVAFNRVTSFRHPRGPRPLVLWGDEGVIGVFALHAAIHGALREAGLASRHLRPIEPHLTLLRDRRLAPDLTIRPVRWWVREFVLVHSGLGEARHHVEHRWPLVGSPDDLAGVLALGGLSLGVGHP